MSGKVAAIAGVAVLAMTGVAAAASHGLNDWPYAADSSHRTVTLAAVGDIACEPDTADNATTPSALKCGSPTEGGMPG